MSSLPAVAGAAVALFAGTNVDDLVVLTLLNVAAQAEGRPRRWQIWAGQYLGFAVLVGLSLAAGRGLSLLPVRWLWLLALIPLALGLIMLAAAIRTARGPEAADPVATAAPGPPGAAGRSSEPGLPVLPGLPPVADPSGWRRLSWLAGVVGVATLTVIDGSDDVAAYTPVFATADGGRIAVVLTVFAVGVAVWCTAGALLTRHQVITDALGRYSRWILPIAFILIGLYTLQTTNAPAHL